jgi:tetratricopeptide (TPR) repeat protein
LAVVSAAGATRAAAAEGDEAAARVAKLNKKAVDEYDNLNFEEARKILKDALDVCRETGLDQHPITARTYIHLGVVTLTGFKQRDAAVKLFRKALEIQPDIKLTKSLANPEIQEAFDEAVASARKSGAAAQAAKNGDKAAGRNGDSGLAHEPITRAAQGRPVPITVTVESSLNADKVLLSYRSGDAGGFVARPMTEATPGNFAADIPAPATAGSSVAYFIEAQKDGEAVATLGSAASPMVVALAGATAGGVRKTRRKEPPPEENGGAARFYAALMFGSGVGWTSGASEANQAHLVDPSGFAPAQLGHLAPEIGYFVRPELLLSLQGRIQLLSGTTTQTCTPPVVCSPSPKYAFAVFAKAAWFFGREKLRPYASLSAGGGYIRHVTEFPQYPECGSDRTTACVETVRAGAVLVGPGAGILYDLTPAFGIVAGLNTQLGFPKFTFNADLNAGVALQF